MRRAGHAKHASHDDRHPGYGRLIDRRQRSNSVANSARSLSYRPQEKAWLIDKIDAGQMEGVTQVNEPSHLLAGWSIEPASPLQRIARQHPHRIAVEPRQPS